MKHFTKESSGKNFIAGMKPLNRFLGWWFLEKVNAWVEFVSSKVIVFEVEL